MSNKAITSHASQAVIDLSACRHNLSVARQAAPDSKCIAVIKANAYGHGMVKIAKALTDAEAFAVARIEEAITLRQAKINTPILLLEGFNSENELELVQKYNFDTVIHTQQQIQILEQSNVKAINVFLKVDSGMHRLGFAADVVASKIEQLEKCSGVASIKLMTHLANADDKHDDKTMQQIETFYQSIESSSKKETSIANSAGILGWPQTHTAWIRPGIMLYGASPFINSHADNHNLKPVMTLSSPLIAIKKLAKGEPIGYGGSYVCEKDMIVGIVAIGYGDGYPRHAKTGTPVLVNGVRSRLLGRVSMDMICIDLTEQPDVNINDSVILWGEGLPVEEIAESSDTISYELLCGVTERVKFKYLD